MPSSSGGSPHQTAFLHATEACVVLSLGGDILEANHAAVALLGKGSPEGKIEAFLEESHAQSLRQALARLAPGSQHGLALGLRNGPPTSLFDASLFGCMQEGQVVGLLRLSPTPRAQSATHDLNNALAAILGLASVMQEETSDQGEARNLTLLLEAARRAQGIVRGMAPPPSPSQLSAHAPVHEVLLVDDDDTVRRSLTFMLQRQGLRVRAASSGSQAIAELENGPFALHVVDLHMPEIDGLTVLDNILSRTPDARALLVSGYTTETVPQTYLDNPRILFLRKPFEYREFSAKIRSLLPPA